MAKAAQDAGLTLDGTVKSMMDLQQKGGLISSKVLPHFAKAMSEAAKANGGLEAALNSNRVAMNQMITGVQMASDTIFKSGWSEGLTDLFKTLGTLFKENEHSFKAFGSVMGKVFKGIAWVIDTVLNPALSALGSILSGVNDAIEATGGWLVVALVPLLKFTPAVKMLAMAMRLLGINTAIAFAPMIAILGAVALAATLVLATLEEIFEFFSPTGKKTLIGFSINDMKPPQWIADFMSLFGSDTTVEGNVNVNSRRERRVGNIPKTSETPVIVQSDIYLGTEKIGKAVARSNAVQSAIDSKVAESTSSNY